MGGDNLVKKLLFLAMFLFWALPAFAQTSTISGVLQNVDSTTCNNCTIFFNSQVTQVISGVTYQPLMKSTSTDGSGNISPITLPQGLVVQISVTENGQTFAPYSAIVPFLSAVTFNQLNQGFLLEPLNVLASLYPPTGALSMNSQKITNLACPTTTDDALAWGCNASVANLTVTGTFNQTTSGSAFFGLLTNTQISTPSITSAVATGTTGATQYYYFLVCHDANGGSTLASASASVANANSTLSASNYDLITWTFPTHSLNCDVLRNTTNTTSGATSTTGGLAVTTSPFKDVSNTTNSYVFPTRNTTGDGQFAGALSAGTPTTGIQTGDLSASRSATTGVLWLGSNGSQFLDFGVTNASEFTLTGGTLVLPGALTIGGVTTLTGGLSAPLAINQGGNGTASPGIVGGTSITVGGTWPTQSVTYTGNPSRSNLQTGAPLATVTNSTSETTMFTYSLSGNTLTANGTLRCHAEGNYLNNAGSSETYTLKFYYGASAILTTTSGATTNGSTPNFWHDDITLSTTGATNTEWGTQLLTYQTQGVADNTSASNTAFADSRTSSATVDSTTSQTVKLTVTLGANTSTQTFTAYSAYCQLQ
jgi:hypothetical protein